MLALLLAAAAAAGQPPLVAVLEFHNQVPGVDLKTNRDGSYLSDVARTAAAEAGMRVMTRENVTVLLQANGKSPADCIDKCEIETARMLGASYVVSGYLLQFGTQLRLSLRLHDTAQGTLVMGAAVGGTEVGALEAGVPEAMNKLLAPLKQSAGKNTKAAALAQDANKALKARDFKRAVELGKEALAEDPSDPETLGLMYRALGYGYAYTGDRNNAVKYLSEYLPYCENDCSQVRQFSGLAPNPPVITHEVPAEAVEGRELLLRAKIGGPAPITVAIVQVRQAGSDMPNTNLPMTQTGDMWAAKVPADLVHGTLEYFIAARNAAGVMARQGVSVSRPFVLHCQAK